jgi:hypothetical protein
MRSLSHLSHLPCAYLVLNFGIVYWQLDSTEDHVASRQQFGGFQGRRMLHHWDEDLETYQQSEILNDCFYFTFASRVLKSSILAVIQQ